MSGRVIAERTGGYVWLLAGAGTLQRPQDDGTSALPDATLLEAMHRAAAVKRAAEAEEARLAAEIARRSEVTDDSSLARRSGERNAVALIARETAASMYAARILLDVGEATAPRRSLVGDALPPDHPHLAKALEAGDLSLDLAKLILIALGKLEKALSFEQQQDLEHQLVETAATWGADYETLASFLKQVPNHVDPDGGKPREDQLRSQVTGWRKQLDNGLTRWQFDLDPERDAYLKAAVDACTAPRRGVIITGADDDGPTDPTLDPTTPDTRTSGERVVEALLTVGKKGMAAADGRVGRNLGKVS